MMRCLVWCSDDEDARRQPIAHRTTKIIITCQLQKLSHGFSLFTIYRQHLQSDCVVEADGGRGNAETIVSVDRAGNV